uniref:Uncharacterized protein n=1 Tax=Anopheles maculatus TaxID=74869 RepID=A0A182TBB3_9DIPT
MRPIISAPSAPTALVQSPSASRIAAPVSSGSGTSPADVQGSNGVEQQPLQNNSTANNGTSSNGVKKSKKEQPPPPPSLSLSTSAVEAPVGKQPVATKPPPVGGKLSWKHFLPSVANKNATAPSAAAAAAAAPIHSALAKEMVVDENNNEIMAPAKIQTSVTAASLNNNDVTLVTSTGGHSNATDVVVRDKKSMPNGCGQNGEIRENGQQSGAKENGTEKPTQSNGIEVKSVEKCTSSSSVVRKQVTVNGTPPLPPSTNGGTAPVRKESLKSEIRVKIASKDEKKEPTVITTAVGKVSSKTLELKRSTSGHRLTTTSSSTALVEENGEKPSINGTAAEEAKEKKRSAYLLTDESGTKTTKGKSVGKAPVTEKSGAIGVRLSLKPSRSVTPDRTEKSGTIRSTTRASPMRTTAADDAMPKERSPAERPRVLGEVKREKTPLRSVSSKSLSAKAETEQKIEVKEVGNGDATTTTTTTVLTSAAPSSSTSTSKVVKVRKVIKKIIKKKPKATTEGTDSLQKEATTELDKKEETIEEKSPAMMGAVETTITHEMADTAVVKGIVEISKMLAKDRTITEKEKKKPTTKSAIAKEEKEQDKPKDVPKKNTTSEVTENGNPSVLELSKDHQLTERKHWAMKKRSITDRALSCGPLEDDRSGVMLEQFLLSLATLPQEIAVDLPEGAPLPRFGSNRSLRRSASQYLSSKIHDFLRRTDHVMQDWRNVGRSLSRRAGDYGVRGVIGDVT